MNILACSQNPTVANATIDIVNPEAPGDELAAGRRH